MKKIVCSVAVRVTAGGSFRSGDKLMNKKDLRDEMRTKRRGVSAAERAAASAAICARLLAMNLKGPVAVYLASAEEIDLTAYIRAALAAGVSLLSPRWTGETYALAPLTGLSAEHLRKGPMGILEPARPATTACRPATWLVPGLAFTRDGERLGYGGGWYDRLMAGVGADVPRLGVAYAFQVVEALPSEPHDIRLTEVLTDLPLVSQI